MAKPRNEIYTGVVMFGCTHPQQVHQLTGTNSQAPTHRHQLTDSLAGQVTRQHFVTNRSLNNRAPRH